MSILTEESLNKANGDIWSKAFRKNSNIVTRKIAGELFLVPIRGSLADMQRIFALTPVAEYVWQQLNTKSLRDICSDITATFDVERDQAESDIQEFISELLDAQLIQE
jgi:Coenzyme PQQ synthesis protein D (PqqD)